jgi:hypothetical protein
MFYAIYDDGQCQERNSLDAIFSLPGKFEVYSISDNRIEYLPNAKTTNPLVISDFEVTVFNRHLLRSQIQVYDHTCGKYFDLYTQGGEVATVLSRLIKDLKLARSFPSFDIFLEYEQLKFEVANLKKENKRLMEKLREKGT